MSVKTIVIFALTASVAVMGYLYYQETKNDVTVEIDPPKIKIK